MAEQDEAGLTRRRLDRHRIALQQMRALNLRLLEAFTQMQGPVASINDPNASVAPIEADLVKGASATVFSFSGLGHSASYPAAEFRSTLRDRPVNSLFFKDFCQLWYQKGLMGVSNSRAETVATLSGLAADLPRPWIFLGSSAGGYAALYFGAKLAADRVIAFSPQTWIDRRTFLRFVPPHCSPDLYDFDDPDNDLAAVVEDSGFSGDAQIFVSARNAFDCSQADRLSDLPTCRIEEVPSAAHNAAEYLKRAGDLHEIIAEALYPGPPVAAQ